MHARMKYEVCLLISSKVKTQVACIIRTFGQSVFISTLYTDFVIIMRSTIVYTIQYTINLEKN